MSSLKAKFAILAAGLMLSGCMQATTYQAAPEATLKPSDKAQLAKARYAKVAVAEPFRRAIVDYHRKEMPGTIVVDSDNHYLYLVQDGGKAHSLRRDRRRGSAGVFRHRARRQHGGMAEMDADRRHPQAH